MPRRVFWKDLENGVYPFISIWLENLKTGTRVVIPQQQQRWDSVRTWRQLKWWLEEFGRVCSYWRQADRWSWISQDLWTYLHMLVVGTGVSTSPVGWYQSPALPRHHTHTPLLPPRERLDPHSSAVLGSIGKWANKLLPRAQQPATTDKF